MRNGTVWTATQDAFTRAMEQTVAPSLTVVFLSALCGAVAVLTPPLWTALRNTVTLVHEIGHAVVGVMVGRRLSGIRMHQDTSGSTVTYGTVGVGGWFTAKVTAFFGYPFPAILALLLFYSVSTGFPRLALLMVVGFLVVLTLFIRNLQALGVMIAHLVVLSGLILWGSDVVLQAVLSGVGWFLLFGGAKSVYELWTQHKRGERGDSDVAILGFNNSVAETVWFAIYGVWYLATVAAVLTLGSGGLS